MTVSLAGSKFTNEALKLEIFDLFALFDPLIKDWNYADIRVSKSTNFFKEVA